MLDRLVNFFTSLRLTVVLLCMGLVLVFWGTIAQVDLGLYKAQNDFFRSFFIFWHPGNSSLKIPIFPGGYMVGGLLLINLLAAHTRYYKTGLKKIGIVMIHGGIVLLVVGQFLTDILSTETAMHIRNGATVNYSEAGRSFELAVIDTTDPKSEKIVAIPGRTLQKGGDITHPDLPFTIRVKKYYANSSLSETNESGYEPVITSAGIGAGIFWVQLPHETAMDRRDMPSGIVELVTPQGSLGNWLISTYLSRPQEFIQGGRGFQLALRPQRFYKPYSVHLLEFKHDVYPGTQIPKNYSSRVRVHHAETGEEHERLIYMNNPMRYEGETYYQASFDTDDQGTILQVVRNPSWLTPYLACILVFVGMTVQFSIHLFGFITKRRSA